MGNSLFEFNFDFSDYNELEDFEYDKNDELDDMIIEAIKKTQNEEKDQPLLIDKNGLHNLLEVKRHLIYIAKKNSTKLKITNSGNSHIVFEIETDLLEFDTQVLKRSLLVVNCLSKFITVESKTNGKFNIIFEVETCSQQIVG